MFYIKSKILSVSSSSFAYIGIFLLIFTITCTDGGRLSKYIPCPRVIGGKDAPKGRFPYMCSIRDKRSEDHSCGGTLIKERWLLTAAHCLDAKYAISNGVDSLVYCDIYRRSENDIKKTYLAKDIYVHGNWESEVGKGYDIALIKLDREADLLVPMLPPQSDTYPTGDGFSVLGWGVTDNEECTDKLQIGLDLAVVPEYICSTDKWIGNITESMICAGGGPVDTAEGDSGGPFLQLDDPLGHYENGVPSRDLVVEITSFGIQEKDRGKVAIPGVYTSVSFFRNWIDCVVEEKIPKDDCPVNFISGPPSPEVNPMPSEPPAYPPDTEESVPPPTVGDCIDIELLEDDFEEQEIAERMKEAIEKDDFVTVECILDAEKNANATNTLTLERLSNDNSSLLHHAAQYNAVESAKVLVDYGANADIRDGREQTPLHVAAEHGSLDVAKVLVDEGANVNAIAKRGDSPLHFAAYYGQESIVEFLVQEGADVNFKNANGATPLHIAAAKGFVSIVKSLVDNKASKSETKDSGETPFDVICQDLHRDAECNNKTRKTLKGLLRKG